MFKLLISITLILFFMNTCQSNKHPDFGLNEKQLIVKYGYPLEVHQVQTEDGYILELHRIPHGKSKKRTKKLPPVLMVSGLLSSSSTWVSFGPERSFGYILADRGYDVWLMNNRGTTWSKGHAYLNSTSSNQQYWGFNLQELGVYDMPAVIDYIINVTEQEKLFYVGYSQGNTVYFILMSEKPEYNQKIRLMISISTTISFKNYTLLFLRLAEKYQSLIERYVKKFSMYELLPRSEFSMWTSQTLCNDDSILQGACFETFCTLLGFNREQLNKTLITVFSSTNPNGMSSSQFAHTQQLINGDFGKFDFGPERNLKEYGQLRPPKYNISKVTSPIALYHGELDDVTIAEVLNKFNFLPNLVKKKIIPKLGHLDIIWGNDAPKLVFHDAAELMNNFH